MVKMDPKNASVTIPEAYLAAIGKVCVQWSILENVLEMMIIKLAGMDIGDSRSKIMINHMSWPQKVDILSAMANELVNGYPRLKDHGTTLPLLKKAQDGRNRIVHGSWANDDGEVKLMRATARGKLKLYMDKITVKEIEEVVDAIHVAIAAIYNLVVGT